ncbi:MAG TPA: response regulator transcription factor [Solirubrobacterales bacterium]|nr:response regulator transcription factor [Solirubrobacterales bacterium]
MPDATAESSVDQRIRVVIADDHRVVRTGLKLLLEDQADISVVAEADDVESARRYVGGHKPDILVLDLNMPGEPSLPAIPGLREQSPNTQIVVLTMQDDPAFAREALRAGALGFVLKRSAEDELVEAVRLAVQGKSFLNPQLGARLAVEPPPGPPDGLDESDVELLRLVALGHTNAEIGERLYMSPRTVEGHRGKLQKRLDLETRADLVRYVLDQGILTRD